MIGSTAEYAALVASVVPMTWGQIVDELPLAIGMQLRNIALYQRGNKITPPGRTAHAIAKQILGDDAESWISGEI